MNLSYITKKYLDKSYNEYSCIKFVQSICGDLGIYFPEHFKKYTIDNHLLYYMQDPIKMQAIMIKAFLSFSEIKNKEDVLQIGDIVIVKRKDKKLHIWPCVYVGRDLAMTSFIDHGVTIFKLSLINKPILKLRLRKINNG